LENEEKTTMNYHNKTYSERVINDYFTIKSKISDPVMSGSNFRSNSNSIVSKSTDKSIRYKLKNDSI